MRLHWQLRRSTSTNALVFGLSTISLALSLITNKPASTITLILIVSVFLYDLLNHNFCRIYESDFINLNWQDGSWTLQTENTTIHGEKCRKSFVLGPLIYLSIRDTKGRNIDLWILPDVIADYSVLNPISEIADNRCKNLLAWRYLHSSFQLSRTSTNLV